MQQKLLIDGDGLVYWAAFAAQFTRRFVETEYGTECFDTHVDFKNWAFENDLNWREVEVDKQIVDRGEGVALGAFDNIMASVFGEMGVNDYEMYLTGEGNFRLLLYPQYKGNRSNREDPIHKAAVIEHAIQRWGAVVVDGMEADDMLCIRATALDYEGVETTVVSEDKDMDTFPGNKYSPKRGLWKFVDPYDAFLNFYSQMLTGDTSDNIPGVRGIGPSKAFNILRECDRDTDMWATVLEYHEQAGYSREFSITIGKLLHMLRHEKDSWEPPT